jgi:radical SAM superfamily enzyme YgiQ (UPF0313 family)
VSARIHREARRHLAAETRRLPRSAEGALRVAVAYPNAYGVGMANLGFHAVLELLHGRGALLVDRCFLPDAKLLAEHRRTRTPLLGLETGLPLGQFHVVLFSVSFEPDYVGLVTMLQLGGIEPLADRRSERAPLVVAGGLAPTLNPEPIAPFCDLVGIGEAEILLPPLLDLLAERPGRDATLARARELAGWYVPAAGPHEVTRQATTLSRPCLPTVLARKAAFASHVDLEISRGCRWRCRFCAAGHVVTPYRELDESALAEPLAWALSQRPRVGLVGTDVSDHSRLTAIAAAVQQLGGQLALPSLTVESVARSASAASRLIRRAPPHTLTMAVEAASETLRQALGKRLSDEKILRAATTAAEAGVRQLRLYFLVGIPGELPAELERIAELAAELRAVGPQLTLSVTGLVPKPGTPLQWEAPPTRRYLREARDLLRARLKGRVELAFEPPDWVCWQALLSLGDRQTAGQILLAAEIGWRRALARARAEVDLLAGTGRPPGAPLPWSHVRRGLADDVLCAERERLLARVYIPPTRLASAT